MGEPASDLSLRLCVAAFLVGCGAAPRVDTPLAQERGPDDVIGTSSGAGDPGLPAFEEEDSSSGEPEDDDPMFDVPADAPALGPCATVDVLFVIDNSGSMADEQLNLIDSFPGFMGGIERTLTAASVHVGVITTDDNAFNDEGCQELGALTTRTGGDLSSNRACGPYAAGDRFMTTADDLDAAFACAAQVGIDGTGIERPMDALTAALHTPGACGAGFIRPEALLVVVVITDEEDDGDSAGDPGQWYDAVIAAKGGRSEDIVVLSLVGHDKPNACIPAQWTGMMGAEIAPRLIDFTERFEHGIVGDVCAPSYAESFVEAVDGIAAACERPAG